MSAPRIQEKTVYQQNEATILGFIDSVYDKIDSRTKVHTQYLKVNISIDNTKELSAREKTKIINFATSERYMKNRGFGIMYIFAYIFRWKEKDLWQDHVVEHLTDYIKNSTEQLKKNKGAVETLLKVNTIFKSSSHSKLDEFTKAVRDLSKAREMWRAAEENVNLKRAHEKIAAVADPKLNLEPVEAQNHQLHRSPPNLKPKPPLIQKAAPVNNDRFTTPYDVVIKCKDGKDLFANKKQLEQFFYFKNALDVNKWKVQKQDNYSIINFKEDLKSDFEGFDSKYVSIFLASFENTEHISKIDDDDLPELIRLFDYCGLINKAFDINNVNQLSLYHTGITLNLNPDTNQNTICGYHFEAQEVINQMNSKRNLQDRLTTLAEALNQRYRRSTRSELNKMIFTDRDLTKIKVEELDCLNFERLFAFIRRDDLTITSEENVRDLVFNLIHRRRNTTKDLDDNQLLKIFNLIRFENIKLQKSIHEEYIAYGMGCGFKEECLQNSFNKLEYLHGSKEKGNLGINYRYHQRRLVRPYLTFKDERQGSRGPISFNVDQFLNLGPGLKLIYNSGHAYALFARGDRTENTFRIQFYIRNTTYTHDHHTNTDRFGDTHYDTFQYCLGAAVDYNFQVKLTNGSEKRSCTLKYNKELGYQTEEMLEFYSKPSAEATIDIQIR